jgi:DNA-directed RNA polymerase specialized sigma24 family protein
MFTWLCQICRNEMAMIYRKQRKSVLTVTADDDAIGPILESLESESATADVTTTFFQ